MTTRKYLPKEMAMRISGRCVEKEDTLYLCHSAAYVEFELEGTYLAVEMASEGGGEDFKAWMGVYVNDMEVTHKRFFLEAGRKEYVLWESDTEEEVLIRIAKTSENQYAYAAICSLILDENAKTVKTEAKGIFDKISAIISTKRISQDRIQAKHLPNGHQIRPDKQVTITPTNITETKGSVTKLVIKPTILIV